MAAPGLVVRSTAKILLLHGPKILTTDYWEPNVPKGQKPCYMKRLQLEPKPNKPGSHEPHGEGRALDITLFARIPTEKEVAENLIEAFLKVRKSLKFISVIYNLKEWNGYGHQFAHIDEEHKTHIHIEWSLSDMALTGFEEELKEAVQFIDGYPVAEAPSGSPASASGRILGPIYE